jgi:hypothetical protein
LLNQRVGAQVEGRTQRLKVTEHDTSNRLFSEKGSKKMHQNFMDRAFEEVPDCAMNAD